MLLIASKDLRDPAHHMLSASEKKDLPLNYGMFWLQVLVEAHTKAQGESNWVFGGLARFVMAARDNDYR